jgi:hypothetical protein
VTEFPASFAPLSVIEPKPVSAGVGNVPTSPVIVVAPVLVIPEPASTAKLEAVPSPTVAWAAPAVLANAVAPNIAPKITTNMFRIIDVPARTCSAFTMGRSFPELGSCRDADAR